MTADEIKSLLVEVDPEIQRYEHDHEGADAYTVWQYQNRDSAGSMPDWLRLRRRERWLREKRTGGGQDDT